MQAVKEIEDGIQVRIDVTPNSSKFKINGYNEWRNEIEVKITSFPQKGKANREIIKEFSKLTNSRVDIVSGMKSQHKTLKIYGISKMNFLELLDIAYPGLKRK